MPPSEVTPTIQEVDEEGTEAGEEEEEEEEEDGESEAEEALEKVASPESETEAPGKEASPRLRSPGKPKARLWGGAGKLPQTGAPAGLGTGACSPQQGGWEAVSLSMVAALKSRLVRAPRVSSPQFTIGSDEDDAYSATATTWFHVDEECGVLSPRLRLTHLLQDRSPASLHR